jgi:DNA-binding beta-propeller fold protein YncE
LTGGTVTMLATGFEDAFHLAVDANNVYVADHGAGTILEIPKMGGTSITLASGLDSPLAVAANSSSTSVFFTTATLIESVPKQ